MAKVTKTKSLIPVEINCQKMLMCKYESSNIFYLEVITNVNYFSIKSNFKVIKKHLIIRNILVKYQTLALLKKYSKAKDDKNEKYVGYQSKGYRVKKCWYPRKGIVTRNILM